MWVGPLKLKAQIFCGEQAAMGPGKAELLETIDKTGSISAAGRAMGMSYRKTWMLVDSMNRCWSDKLVEAIAGGGEARGARLTVTGRAVLAAFRSLEAHILAAATGDDVQTLSTLLRDGPLPEGACKVPSEP
jgi:molybdate transport system regulatory protein